jgi:TPP-dependent pyruvate/acetoin dehydrogenase alpha subunit
VICNLLAGDIVVSNHRCHGHFIAAGGDIRALFAELMGRATGVCGGRGGSQHLHWNNFYSNGVLGGTLPMAAGMALAEKLKGNRTITVVFLGDGALDEGIVYETLNISALKSVPLLFVVENNHIAQTTPIQDHLAGDISARFQAFDIPVVHIDTSDVLIIRSAAADACDAIRTHQRPRALVLETNRFGPHSKGDDTRPAELIALLRETRDPISIHAGRIDPNERTACESDVEQSISEAFRQALGDPFPSPSDVPVNLH